MSAKQAGNDCGTNSLAQYPQVCHCEEANGRRGALSAQREEVPLGCNLAVPGRIEGKQSAKTEVPSRDSHVASLLGMTRQGGAAVHQCPPTVEFPRTRRSMSAATGLVGVVAII